VCVAQEAQTLSGVLDEQEVCATRAGSLQRRDVEDVGEGWARGLRLKTSTVHLNIISNIRLSGEGSEKRRQRGDERIPIANSKQVID
jgi:hypothetical protein